MLIFFIFVKIGAQSQKISNSLCDHNIVTRPVFNAEFDGAIGGSVFPVLTYVSTVVTAASFLPISGISRLISLKWTTRR